MDDESKMFGEGPELTQEQAEKSAAIGRIKDRFSQSVLEYRGLLKDTTLERNKTQAQRDFQTRVLQDLNKHAGDLEQINVGEGIFSLAFIALHSLLLQHDEINSLKFQNYMLHKQIKSLESKLGDQELENSSGKNE